MTEIKEIPLDEMKQDAIESMYDIVVCGYALENGITSYSGGSIKGRLVENVNILRVIIAELIRRLEPNQ